MDIDPHPGQDMQANQDQGDDGNDHHPAQEEAHHEIEDEQDFENMPREEACEAAREEGSKTVTMLKYYAYRLFQRCEEFSPILYAGRLYQQLVVDAYAAVEQARLEWVTFNQTKLRADLYRGVVDALLNEDAVANLRNIGRRVILPATFIGSARYMYRILQVCLLFLLFSPNFFC